MRQFINLTERQDMSTRLYKVSMGGHVHLVEASNQAQAIRHVVQGKVKASVVSALEAGKLIGEKGHTIEVAGKIQEQTTEE